MTPIFTILAAVTAAPDTVPQSTAPGDIVVTAQQTKGVDEYTVPAQTSAYRLPISLRDTPQAVSVVTRQQIDDFQLNDINALLATVPGFNVQPQETDRFYYSARGFDVQNFQVDGLGLPPAFAVQVGSIDTAIYDHVEVLKGAPGLLSPVGNPSAVVNFVRKRPTRDFQATGSAQYGSFNSLRLQGDVSTPLDKDGHIRALAVGVYSDADSYLDRYHLRRWTGYGIVEADLGPNTVASMGYGYQNHHSSAAQWGAIPLYYTDGTRIPLARSSNTAPDWAGFNVTDRQIFGDITHHFNDKWLIKASAFRRATNEQDDLFYVYGNPDRSTGLGVFSYPGSFKASSRDFTFDVHASGSFQALGQEQMIVFGFLRGALEYRQLSRYDNAAIGVSIPLDQLFSGSFPRPNFPATYSDNPASSNLTHQRRTSAYATMRLRPVDPLKIILGANYTWARSEGYSYGSPSNYRDNRFLPFVGATLDLTRHVSAYASYATIFNPQNVFGAGGTLLAPIKGNSLEGGFKGEWYEGRLNAALSVFRVRQDNFAEAAGFDPTIGQTIYRGVNSKSEGVELEFGGQLLPGVQATGGYTIMRIRGDDGQPTRTFVPRQTAKLNLTYTPPVLPALKLGASLQYQTKIYVVGSTTSTITGQPIRVTQDKYATLDLLGSYKITKNLQLAVNVRNVTNTKAINALTYDQGYYNAPRSVLGTVTISY
ncbi:TonB-dependent siderophore receptor [Sphingomonas fuzhouensis]|uniref:TonB-dependent siderophore receptor n=1 Tax=Sphingomonas fuzhouensis TaxID=3106033 RepID=UPI002AFF8F3F|nr:TonB-dependent siderophore receptor [Sphingomonas sp. SGZ-02]